MLNSQLSGGGAEARFAGFVDFHGANTHTTGNFRAPTRCH